MGLYRKYLIFIFHNILEDYNKGPFYYQGDSYALNDYIS